MACLGLCPTDLWVDQGAEDGGDEEDPRVHPHVVVLGRQLDPELEDAVTAPTKKLKSDMQSWSKADCRHTGDGDSLETGTVAA